MPATPLSPAEAFVLLDPQTARPSEAFKIAFLALVATGVIRVAMTEKSGLWRHRRSPIVSLAADPPDTLLTAEIIRTIHRARPSSIGIRFPAIAKSAVEQFGPALIRLKKDFILPSLAARGLLTPREGRFLIVFNRTIHLHTAAGLAEKQRIESTLAEAAFLPSLLHTDRARANAILLAAGPLLLLVPELKGYYRQLATLDFWAFDAGALDLDFGSFDASFDASFSDGGADGGGHGGDGGGGGGGGH